VPRGDVYEFRLLRGGGHEQRGRRFGVLVQANEMLPRSVVLVAPTSTSARSASFRPEIEVRGEATKLLVEQVGAMGVAPAGNLSTSPARPCDRNRAATTGSTKIDTSAADDNNELFDDPVPTRITPSRRSRTQFVSATRGYNGAER
jgi:mRNA interferase MazF